MKFLLFIFVTSELFSRGLGTGGGGVIGAYSVGIIIVVIAVMGLFSKTSESTRKQYHTDKPFQGNDVKPMYRR